MDKSSPAGAMGAMFNEVSAAIYGVSTNNKPLLSNYVYGLGERDLTQKDIRKIYSELAENVKAGKLTHNAQQWICLRGKEMGFH